MDDLALRSAPATGVAKPGNLYVDLQSRQLWLGVATTTDPTGSVLISDLLALQTADTTTLNNAKAYTDTQILTRAPTVHNHTASQVSDFTAAVQAVIAATPTAGIPSGMIAMYSGSLANIGVGSYAGWALCNGANGTPDLRDRFIIGAGNLATGAKNPNASVNTDNKGGHTPVAQSCTLTLAQIPSHQHAWSDSGTFLSGGRTAAHNHTFGDASYNFVGWKSGGSASLGTTWGGGQPLASMGTTLAAETQEHQHYVNVSLGGNTDLKGSSGGHTHIMNSVADHFHTLTSAQIRDTAPYYALAFIMKL